MKDCVLRSKRWLVVTVGLVLGALTAPAQSEGFRWFFKHVRPTGQCSGGQEVAVSYYNFIGRRTANGETFNPKGMTAAHRSLPFGTTVRLTNPRNGRSVMVRINDRGPYGRAHALGVKYDLARGAAWALGLRETNWVCVNSGGMARAAAPGHQQTELPLAW
jgi:rare lipoprotein A